MVSSNNAVRVRFAPSPTGYLHMGHIVSALYVWGLAKALGAKIILRIEDHDRGRCRNEYEVAIFEDLKWLGLNCDIGDAELQKPSLFRQSDCEHFYQEALDCLIEAGYIYECTCSRKEIAAVNDQRGKSDSELYYTGTCRHKSFNHKSSYGLRFRVDSEKIQFLDGFLGTQEQCPEKQCGDFLVKDRDGQWTYQFSVVVDDIRQGVNFIIRGQDILSSTARQLLLAKALNQKEMPFYCHHPLVYDLSGQKLSKRTFADAISKRRTAGESPEVILREAATLIGIEGKEEKISLGDILAWFAEKVKAQYR